MILTDVQHCMKTINEFYVFLTKVNGWKFFYENFIYRVCFEQAAPWHSDKYGMQILSKKHMWHIKNTQLKKISCRSSLFYWFISFTAKLRHLRFSMVEQLQSRLAIIGSKRFLFIWSEKRFLSVLLGGKKNHMKNHAYLLIHNKYSIWLLKKYSRLQHLSLSGHL